MSKEALVIKRDVLFGSNEFQGFVPISERDLSQIILDKKNHFYHSRGEDLEKNESLQQVIPYVWIVNPDLKRVFLYKRELNQSKEEGEFKETRYLNKFSGGVGGHIDRDTEEGTDNPIENAMMRELQEEVEMGEYNLPRIVGYINDDSDSIGKVHFGVVAIAHTNGDVSSKSSEGLSPGGFYSVEEVDFIFSSSENEVENWTKMSWPFVKEYLSKL